jgi:hypothetical protein
MTTVRFITLHDHFQPLSHQTQSVYPETMPYSTISEAVQKAIWEACLALEALALGDPAQAEIDKIKEACKEPVDKTYVTGWHG